VEAQARAADVRQVVERLRAGMQEVEAAVSRSEVSVHRLQEHSTSALAFADILRDVAEQTHVLSMNASLEAARAGPHGLGFAVVAQEVRRLASVATRSSGEVTQVVGRMTQQMDKVLEAAGSIGETTQRLTVVLGVAGSTLESIQGFVAQQKDDMGASTDDAGRQAQDTAGISEACMRLRGLVEAHALTSADVAASIGELGALSSELKLLLPAR
jgi:methyl-accepting chemotaxis protein